MTPEMQDKVLHYSKIAMTIWIIATIIRVLLFVLFGITW